MHYKYTNPKPATHVCDKHTLTDKHTKHSTIQITYKHSHTIHANTQHAMHASNKNKTQINHTNYNHIHATNRQMSHANTHITEHSKNITNLQDMHATCKQPKLKTNNSCKSHTQ